MANSQAARHSILLENPSLSAPKNPKPLNPKLNSELLLLIRLAASKNLLQQWCGTC